MEKVDLKQPVHNTSIKFIRNVILATVFLFVIIIGIMKLYNYYNRNPFLIELQQIVAEQYGTDFSVTINCSKNEKISLIEIEATDEIYLKEDIFYKVDNLQKIIYKYVMHNQEQFCNIDMNIPQNDEKDSEKKRLKVLFENSDWSNSSGLSNVFCFYNRLEYKNEYAEGFNSLHIITRSRQPDSHYSNIKTSALVNFDDVSYIKCWNINIDDTSSLKMMKNLKEISAGRHGEELKKVAKEVGIKCD